MLTSKQHQIIAWLDAFARNTWDRIGFVYGGKRGKIFETTLTQNLVYALYCDFKDPKLPLQLWEAYDEKTNGDDLEIAVETPKGFLLFPCQAKLCYKNGKYSKIDHPGGSTLQIESLLEYSKRRQGNAIYLFYNYCSDREFIHKVWARHLPHVPRFGCSVALAANLYERHCIADPDTGRRKWNIPSFMELHPFHAYPLSYFIEQSMQLTPPSTGWLEYLNRIHFYSYDELADRENWKNLTPAATISGILSQAYRNDTDILDDEDNNYQFNPRYRIIVGQKPRTKSVAIYRVG